MRAIGSIGTPPRQSRLPPSVTPRRLRRNLDIWRCPDPFLDLLKPQRCPQRYLGQDRSVLNWLFAPRLWPATCLSTDRSGMRSEGNQLVGGSNPNRASNRASHRLTLVGPAVIRSSRWRRLRSHQNCWIPVRGDGGAVKRSISLACSVLGVFWLNGCDRPTECSGENYRGGCVVGAPSPVVVTPTAARPVEGPAPAAAPAAVGRGEPSDFADVDDKQCRSYGLTFGTHDYADCRIRLSAQHRGLDPNIDTTAPSPGVR